MPAVPKPASRSVTRLRCGTCGKRADGDVTQFTCRWCEGTTLAKTGQRAPLKRRQRMRPRSAKTEASYAGEGGRWEFVVSVLTERGRCEACPRLPDARFKCSSSMGMDVHELLPRSAGGSILDEANVIAVCRSAHLWIHSHPAKARELGLLKSRYG